MVRTRDGGDHDCKVMVRGMWLGVGMLPMIIMILEGYEVHNGQNDDEKGMMKMLWLAVLEIMVLGDDGDPHGTKASRLCHGFHRPRGCRASAVTWTEGKTPSAS